MLISSLEKERILDFLRRCAELILHDIRLENPSDPFQPDPGEVVLANEGTQHSSLQTEIVEAPYRLPPRHDMSRLRSFVFAKRDEYLDEIWNLREDPAHFTETILEWAEHRHEQVRMADGNVSPQLGKKQWWEKTINTVVADAYTSFHAWNCLSKQVENLAALKDSYGDRIHDDNTLPTDYEDAILYLAFLVIQAMKRLIVKWKDGLAASPQLRTHFAIDKSTGDGYPKVPWDQQKDKFLWLLEIPLFDDIFRISVSSVTDAIDWMISTDQNNRNRLSPWLVSVVSELSLLGELQRQTSLLHERPVWTQHARPDNRRLEEYDDRIFDDTEDLIGMYQVLDNGLELVPFAMPFDKFNFPCHKRRTAITTRAMQEAEKALDKFWQHIDNHTVSICSVRFHQLFKFEIEERELARTPDWSDADAPQPTPKGKSIAEAPLEDDLASKLHFEWHDERAVSQETVATPKQKIKTRGIPGEPAPQDAGISHEAETTQEEAKIAVSKRAMKTFSILFFDDSHEAPPGELPWTEFLHAMASAGFTSQKLNGSAWIFEPTNDNLRRGIIFHEPHPVAKIRYHIARTIGRRLNRAYGWTLETFERAPKALVE